MIRIFIAEAEKLSRSTLRLAIESDPQCAVVGEAETAAETLEQVRALRPDCLLLDTKMPGREPLDLIAAIRRHSPSTRILVTADEPTFFILFLNNFGAHGIAPRSLVDRDELLEAIHGVLRTSGHFFTVQQVRDTLAKEHLGSRRTVLDGLAHRQASALRLLAQEKSIREIADEMTVGTKGIYRQLETVAERFGVPGLQELRRLLARHPLDDPWWEQVLPEEDISRR